MPERADFHLGNIKIELGTQTKDIKFKGEIIISIKYSQIAATLNIDTDQDIPTLKIAVEQVVRNAVDTYGYLSGRGYDIEITSAVDPDGNQTVFGVGIPEIESTSKERPFNFVDTFTKVVMNSKEFQHALTNLRECIRSPWDTPFFCYRAIECLRQHFSKEGDKDKSESWEKLRNALRLDKSWFDELTKNSEKVRHGFIKEIKYSERVQAMLDTWKVIDRFCIYYKNGQNDLSEDYNLLKKNNGT